METIRFKLSINKFELVLYSINRLKNYEYDVYDVYDVYECEFALHGEYWDSGLQKISIIQNDYDMRSSYTTSYAEDCKNLCVQKLSHSIINKVVELITKKYPEFVELEIMHVIFDEVHAALSRNLHKSNLVSERWAEELSQFRFDPHFHFNQFFKQTYTDEAEEKAKQLLVTLLDENEKSYYTIYQAIKIYGKIHKYIIYPGDKMTEVYGLKNDEYLGKLCLIFKDCTIPPTDSLIMKYLLIKADENKFINKSNKFDSLGNTTYWFNKTYEFEEIFP